MKLREFAGPAIMVLIITSFMTQQMGNNNPGHRSVTMQEFSGYSTCNMAAEAILQTEPGAVDSTGHLTGIVGAQNTHRQVVTVYCFPK